MMINKNPVILASGSPRRQHLLRELGLDFEIRLANVEERFPPDLPVEKVPQYLAEKKVRAVASSVSDKHVVIGADTVVILDGKIIEKPSDAEEAKRMINELSGKMHQVITGVCMRIKEKMKIFSDTTKVYFHDLEDQEIDYYIRHFAPFDKAGSYAIQEWIGMMGIDRIEGDYFNVMGLPVRLVYRELKGRVIE